jgi:hypothetical protein
MSKELLIRAAAHSCRAPVCFGASRPVDAGAVSPDGDHLLPGSKPGGDARHAGQRAGIPGLWAGARVT